VEDGGCEGEGRCDDEGEVWYLFALLGSGISICLWYDIPSLPVSPTLRLMFHPLPSIYPPHRVPAQTCPCPPTAFPC